MAKEGKQKGQTPKKKSKKTKVDADAVDAGTTKPGETGDAASEKKTKRKRDRASASESKEHVEDADGVVRAAKKVKKVKVAAIDDDVEVPAAAAATADPPKDEAYDFDALAQEAAIPTNAKAAPKKEKKSTKEKRGTASKSKRNREALRSGNADGEGSDDADEDGADAVRKRVKTEEKKSKKLTGPSVWIGNLSYTTTKKSVEDLLSKAGAVKGTMMKMKGVGKTRINQGSAFVFFEDLSAVEKAVAMSETVLDGRNVLIKAGRSRKAKAKDPFVIVNNLKWGVSKEDIASHFQKCGEIAKIYLPTTENVTHGYVYFKDEAAIEKAKELNGTDLSGRKIRIKVGSEEPAKAVGDDAAKTSVSKLAAKPQVKDEKKRAPAKAKKFEGESKPLVSTKPASTSLFLGNLGFDCTEKIIAELLKKIEVAEVRKVRMPKFEDSGKCKGFGYVDFATVAICEQAFQKISSVSRRSIAIGGRLMNVDYAGYKACIRAKGRRAMTGAEERAKSKEASKTKEKFTKKEFNREDAPDLFGGSGDWSGRNKNMMTGGIVKSEGTKITFDDDDE